MALDATALPTRAARLMFPVLAALLIVTWSSGFVGIRYASEDAPVLLVLFWRTLVAGLVLLPFALLFGPPIAHRALLQQIGFGVFGNFIYLGGFAYAIGERVPTGLVALTADLVPLAVAALSMPLLGQPLTGRQWLGTAIGVFGVALVSADSLSLGHATPLAYLLPIAAMLSFAAAIVMQKKLGAVNMPVHQSIAIQNLTAMPLFGLCAWWSGGLAPPASASFAFGIAWLVLFATFACYGTYFICLRLYPAHRITSVIYLSPPVTMLWAAAMFGEPLTLMMLAGLGVTFIGVSLAARGGGSY